MLPCQQQQLQQLELLHRLQCHCWAVPAALPCWHLLPHWQLPQPLLWHLQQQLWPASAVLHTSLLTEPAYNKQRFQYSFSLTLQNKALFSVADRCQRGKTS